MDPVAGLGRKLNPSSPEAGVMLTIFVKDSVGDVLWWTTGGGVEQIPASQWNRHNTM